MLSQQEKTKLREIVRLRCVETKAEDWSLLLEERSIRRMGKITHLCMPPELGEVRVDDPWGNYLGMTEETARKILVLGM